MRPRSQFPLVGYFTAESCFVNLAGDYRYLSSGYYASLDQEPGLPVCHPTCKEALDAYVTPLLLEKARLAGIPVPGFYLTNKSFEPPVLIDTVNPFMTRRTVVVQPGQENGQARSLTRNFTYAICCQQLPARAQVVRFQTVLGWCAEPRFRPLTAAAWRLFRIPMATLRVLDIPDGETLLSGLEPLPFRGLGPEELAYLNGVVQWPT